MGVIVYVLIRCVARYLVTHCKDVSSLIFLLITNESELCISPSYCLNQFTGVKLVVSC